MGARDDLLTAWQRWDDDCIEHWHCHELMKDGEREKLTWAERSQVRRDIAQARRRLGGTKTWDAYKLASWERGQLMSTTEGHTKRRRYRGLSSFPFEPFPGSAEVFSDACRDYAAELSVTSNHLMDYLMECRRDGMTREDALAAVSTSGGCRVESRECSPPCDPPQSTRHTPGSSSAGPPDGTAHIGAADEQTGP